MGEPAPSTSAQNLRSATGIPLLLGSPPSTLHCQGQLIVLAERIHLRWFFAAEDEGRSEEPSEQKIRKAREEGRVARSLDFSLALSMLVGTAALLLIGPFVYRRCAQLLNQTLGGSAGQLS